MCAFEAATIKQALQTPTFSADLEDKLLMILGRSGLRMCPSGSSQLNAKLPDVAKYHFLINPMAAINIMHNGVSPEEKQFWESLGIEELHALYLSLSATAEKVLSIIDEPMEYYSSCQLRVFGYLQQYIGNMRNDEARRFLRFTTGSSVMTSERINITFNAVKGFGRHPVGRTCGCTLELPSTYESYLEFEQEFNCILKNNDYDWKMYVA